MTLAAGLAVIALAVFAVVRRVDVRLALTLAALALGLLARQPEVILQTFLVTLSREQFVVPICTAMGFAYVLRHTDCDRHLVHLLIKPVRRVRLFLIPGTVLVGFLVNIPIISQTSTTVTIGAVIVPLLRAARLSSVTIGAALLLGSSIGGELLNPGAPELQTVSTALNIASTECVARVAPLLFVHLAVATALFWVICTRAEAKTAPSGDTTSPIEAGPEFESDFRVNYLKAAVPLVPLALLFLTGPPLQLIDVPRGWLIGAEESAKLRPDSRLIGAAMLVGVATATVVAWRSAGGVARAFFDGAGYAFAHIISLIVSANCFGEGVKAIGLARVLGDAIDALPGSLAPCAAAFPLAFAAVSGSGFASTASLFGFFVEPSRSLGVDPAAVGAVVSLASAAGRTLSPVAAVALMCASMTDTTPLALSRRVAGPLLAGLVVVLLLRAVF